MEHLYGVIRHYISLKYLLMQNSYYMSYKFTNQKFVMTTCFLLIKYRDNF